MQSILYPLYPPGYMSDCLKCGVCCKLFLINLTEEEYRSRKYKTVFEDIEFVKDFIEAEIIGANILKQNEEGVCVYLKNGVCSIHDNRPKSCRNFFCDSKEEQFKDMIREIKEHKNKR